MNNLKTLLMWLLGVSLLASCYYFPALQGNGLLRTEDRTAGLGSERISGLAVTGVGTVQLIRGITTSVQINTDANLLEHIVTRVENGILELGVEPGVSITGYTRLEFIVVLPTLRNIDSSGVATIHTVGSFSGPSLNINNSGTADIQFSGVYTSVTIAASGTGSLSLSGTAETLDVSSSGVGSLHAFGFPVKNAVVDLSGVGNVELQVSESLRATISGLGSISYRGNATLAYHDITGLGTIRHIITDSYRSSPLIKTGVQR